MKRFFKTSGKIIAYLFIYLFSQVSLTMGVGIYYAIKFHNTKTSIQLQELLMKNIYLITLGAAILALIVYILILSKREENLWQRCRFKKVDLKSVCLIICATIGTSFMTCSFIVLTQNIFKSYDQVSKNIASGTQTTLALIAVIILVPIFEEILFRGLIFNLLRKNTNIVVSIIIQALIFAVFHGNLMQGIYAFLLGVIAALVYLWTKSILSDILLHTCFNLLGTLVVPQIVDKTLNLVYLYFGMGIIILSVTLVFLYKNTHQKPKRSITYEISI